MGLFLGFLICELVGIAIGTIYSDSIKAYIRKNFN